MRRLLAPVVLPVLVALLALAPSASAAGTTARVVGGTTATATDAPWQALVLPGGYLCGGSILDETHVLTAAHCVYDEEELTVIDAGDITIRAGIVDRWAVGGQTRAVSAVSVNPSYAPDLQTGDAAILTLSTPLTLGATVAAIGPTDLGWRPVDGVTNLQLTGWGSTAARAPEASPDGAVAAQMLQVVKTIKSTSTCSTVYSPFPDNLLLCAGQAGLDACQGDSGGPLAVQDNGVWKLAGIVTGGAGCAWSGFPGYYARVSEPSIRQFILDRGVGSEIQKPAFTRQPAISGTPEPGQALTCDPGATINAYNSDVAWAQGSVLIAGGSTLTLRAADLGATLQCVVYAYGLGGTVAARSAAITVRAPATPPPPTPIPTPKQTPSPITDVAAPTVKVLESKCSRTLCILEVRVEDPAPSAGVKGLEATVRTAYRTTCKVKGKRRSCTKHTSKRLTAVLSGTHHTYKITTPKLRKGTHTFTLIGIDAIGHRQAKATTLKKTTR